MAEYSIVIAFVATLLVASFVAVKTGIFNLLVDVIAAFA